MKFRILYLLLALVIVGGSYVLFGNSSENMSDDSQAQEHTPAPSADDEALRRSLGQ